MVRRAVATSAKAGATLKKNEHVGITYVTKSTKQRLIHVARIQSKVRGQPNAPPKYNVTWIADGSVGVWDPEVDYEWTRMNIAPEKRERSDDESCDEEQNA